ncbi:MAG: cupin domain-containing protein [Lachnospiraceae bacterium]|nr:cupin domain-containing protein [Lachnospiraceae bacterium]
MTTKSERMIIEIPNAQGGKGVLKREPLMTPMQQGEHCGLFAEIKLEPGCTLGFHEHHGDTETYYITSGKGVYNQNGTKVDVKAGDVLFCPDGEGHALDNSGTTDLIWIALILKA